MNPDTRLKISEWPNAGITIQKEPVYFIKNKQWDVIQTDYKVTKHAYFSNYNTI